MRKVLRLNGCGFFAREESSDLTGVDFPRAENPEVWIFRSEAETLAATQEAPGFPAGEGCAGPPCRGAGVPPPLGVTSNCKIDTVAVPAIAAIAAIGSEPNKTSESIQQTIVGECSVSNTHEHFGGHWASSSA